ncbi:MAG: hypothetical protein IPN07_05080 [Dehalococcoidia bacterium]|nr:hypothetical protein [Dehalococcoidia bacterium]
MLIVLLLSVIASALLVAGTTKVLDLQRFKRTVNSYEKLPRFTRQLAVPVVPGLEAMVACCSGSSAPSPRLWVLDC